MAVAIIALMSIRSINPATGETLKSFDELSEQQIEAMAAPIFRNVPRPRVRRANWGKAAKDRGCK